MPETPTTRDLKPLRDLANKLFRSLTGKDKGRIVALLNEAQLLEEHDLSMVLIFFATEWQAWSRTSAARLGPAFDPTNLQAAARAQCELGEAGTVERLVASIVGEYLAFAVEPDVAAPATAGAVAVMRAAEAGIGNMAILFEAAVSTDVLLYP